LRRAGLFLRARLLLRRADLFLRARLLLRRAGLFLRARLRSRPDRLLRTLLVLRALLSLRTLGYRSNCVRWRNRALRNIRRCLRSRLLTLLVLPPIRLRLARLNRGLIVPDTRRRRPELRLG
jgi:hypothetical protein